MGARGAFDGGDEVYVACEGCETHDRNRSRKDEHLPYWAGGRVLVSAQEDAGGVCARCLREIGFSSILV